MACYKQQDINIILLALSVFTDFTTAGPRVIESSTRARRLFNLMKKEHVRDEK